MVREDKVLMSVKELRRLQVIHQVIEKKITQVEAGGLLGLTDRQVRRISKRVREGGDQSIVHRSRGKRSNRAIDGNIKARVMKVYGTTSAVAGAQAPSGRDDPDGRLTP